MSKVPSNNKGWKSHYFFINCSWRWGFGLLWSSRSINNSPSGLSNDEYVQLEHLKEILSSSRMIRNMTEMRLVETGLSPTPRGVAHAHPPTLALVYFITMFTLLLSYLEFLGQAW